MTAQPIHHVPHHVSSEETQRRMDFVDAANAVANIEISDERARRIIRRVASGEISGDKGVKLAEALLGITVDRPERRR